LQPGGPAGGVCCGARATTGTHVATTVAPILAEAVMSPQTTPEEKMWLSGIYLPYLVVPIMCTVYFALYPEPFGPEQGGGGKAKTQ